MEFNSFGFTDPGKIHDHNEDSFLCNEDERIFLVADGMGGQSSGETASKLAIDSIEEFIINSRAKEGLERPNEFEYRNELGLEDNRFLSTRAVINAINIHSNGRANVNRAHLTKILQNLCGRWTDTKAKTRIFTRPKMQITKGQAFYASSHRLWVVPASKNPYNTEDF